MRHGPSGRRVFSPSRKPGRLWRRAPGRERGSVTGERVFERAHPGGRLCPDHSTAQNLPGDEAFVGWGGEPGFSEFFRTSDKRGPYGGCGIV